MIEKIKILLSGDKENQILAITLANNFIGNSEIMNLMNRLAIESLKNNIPLFFEILDQDYASELNAVKNLTELVCSENQPNQLTSLPESIGKLEKLEILNCWENQLKTLPESIGKLRKIETLNCSNNPLESIPDSAFKISDLKYSANSSYKSKNAKRQ